jgi:hypothetical protein
VDPTPAEVTTVAVPANGTPPATTLAGGDTRANGTPPATTSAARDDGSTRGIALLLGAAAILAAVIGARASALASDAGDAWQSALRSEVKRAAAVTEDVRYLYQVELQPALGAVEARLLRDELTSAAAGLSGAVQTALQVEADVQAALLGALEPSSELATTPGYALPAGGLDLGRRLADLRAKYPDLLALDPDAAMAAGDATAAKSDRMMLALLPLSVAALLGALAQPFARRRRLLLAAGVVALGIGAVAAAAVELVG